MKNIKKIKEIDIESELKKSYLNYAMSVIVGRALPDIRDGLKPVHRRILYAMYILKNNYNKAYKKSARIVGDVIGKYHPHGDSAVYESIVRMAQSFSMRYPLIDGQGNFGSVDGDPAAAMRYTEIRMSKITKEFLKDIEKETINFFPNYDSTEKIPEILPTIIPNILINGATGIAVGMATNIPPHNISEVMNMFIKFMKNKNLKTKQLIKYIKGPDFPTGGIIEDNNGIYNAYKTGKGNIKIIAKIKIENNTFNNKKNIIINQLPYQTNKSKIIKKIIELMKEKIINEIKNIRDESDQNGMRIVIETKKHIKRKILINKLIKLTNLKISYGINIVALYKNRPKLLNLKEIIKIFIKHRKNIIKKKIIFKLKKYKKKIHLFEGILISLYNIKKILDIIKKSKNKKSAINKIKKKKWKILINFKNLIKTNKKYKFSIEQINNILKLSLIKLTKIENKNIYIKYKKIRKKIKKFKKILNNKKLIYKIIEKQFIYIKKKFGDKRITKIKKNIKLIKINDLIKKEQIIIILSKLGYIKYKKLSKLKIKNKGRIGKNIIKLKDKDKVNNMIITNTHKNLLLFTNKGRIFYLRIFKILNFTKNPTGKPIVNFINLSKNEIINYITSINKKNLLKKYIILITKNGLIKKIKLNKINFKRKNGVNIINLKNKDKIINIHITNGNNQIMIFTKNGKTVRFLENKIRDMGKNAYGIKGISLINKDKVASSLMIKHKYKTGYIIIITKNGYGKKTSIKEFPIKSRAIKGLISIKINIKNSFIIKAIYTTNKNKKQQILIITNKGNILRIYTKNINIFKRNTQGIILIRLKNLEEVIQCEKI